MSSVKVPEICIDDVIAYEKDEDNRFTRLFRVNLKKDGY